MPIIDGLKLSCQVCLRGHRSAVCNHYDRELFPVRPKGRPAGGVSSQGGSTAKSKGRPPCMSSGGSKKRKTKHEDIQVDNLDQVGRRRGGSSPNNLIGSTPPSDLDLDLDLESPPQESRMSVHTLLSDDSTPKRSNSSSSSSHSSGGNEFNLDLDCTCSDPCPCPGCPGKHVHTKRPPPLPKPASDEGRLSCCTKETEIVTPPKDGSLCGSCLPCVIAPYEKVDEDKEKVIQPDTRKACCST